MSTKIKTPDGWKTVANNIVAVPFIENRRVNRGIIFDSTNRHGLVIKKGWEWTIYDENDNPVNYQFTADTHIDLGTLTAGKAYTVQASVNSVTKAFSFTADATGAVTERTIAWFDTLCVNAGDALTATIPADPGSLNVGDFTLVKCVPENSDFYDFYNKKVIAVTRNSIYDTVTVEHTLRGFNAGDILPESVWCTTFRPYANPNGMVYDPETGMAIDIYLQSGKGRNTKSVYGGTTTRSRQYENRQADMRAVGKLLISDSEFTSAALGSNEKTNIAGSAETSIVTTGGHVDTASRRMVSFIGAEDMCGSLWHWLRDVSANNGSGITAYDGVGSFGQTNGTILALLAGGTWAHGAYSGSRCRFANATRSDTNTSFGGRGVSHIVRGV